MIERDVFVMDDINMDNKDGFIFKRSRSHLPDYLNKYYSNIDYAVDNVINHGVHFETPANYNNPYDSSCSITKKNNFFNLCDKKEIVFKAFYSVLCDDHDYLIKEVYRLLFVNDKCNTNNFSYNSILNLIYSIDNSIDKEKTIERLIYNMPFNGIYKKPSIRITCFSELNDSMLMWTYYTNSYKGVCLGFDTRKDIVLFNNAHAVDYRKDICTNINNINYLFQKSSDWAHEKEWRIVSTSNNDFFNTNSISSIILGSRISTDNLIKMIKLANEYNLSLFFLWQNSDKY